MKKLFSIILISLLLASCQSNVLKFEIVKKQNISYLNTPRMVNRIVLDVNSLPTKQEVENTATSIWKDGNETWKEFTVFIYLPEMNTEQMAYGVGEYNENGLVYFYINKDALLGTKWEIKKTNKPIKQIPVTELKKYSIKIHATNTGKRKAKIIIHTNFPNGTILSLSTYRIYYVKGDTAVQWAGLFGKDFSVEQGKIETTVEINDSAWYHHKIRFAKLFPNDFPPIAKISNNIIIDVTYTSAAPQPTNVVKILGAQGEFVTGVGVTKYRGGSSLVATVLDASMKLNIPFKK